MRALAAPLFERSPYLLGPVFTLTLFFFVFVLVVVWVVGRRRSEIEALERIPLEDGPEGESPARREGRSGP